MAEINTQETEIIPLLTGTNVAATPRAKRADALANRKLILATAQRLFAERGITHVCMAMIAETAGIGKGTLYRAFANKGELCLALLDEAMCNFQNETLQTLRDNYNQPALGRLDLFLNSLVYFMDCQAPLLREVRLHEVGSSEVAARENSPHMWLPWLHMTVGGLLQQAQQNGEAENLDIPYLVDAILAPLSADLFLYQREIRGFELERISRGFRRLVLEGVQTWTSTP